MDSRHYWEETGHNVKYENYNSSDDFTVRGTTGCSDQLNFATAPSEDEGDFPQGYMKKGKVTRQQDPMSHRIIEKRRRDRMNNCLADLSRLIPTEYLKKGRGRVEKTEIIEMAIRHLKYLQDRVNGISAADRQDATETEHYRAGYQEATSETLRYLVEVQGYGSGDGICVQLNTHLQRHCDNMTKVELKEAQQPRDKSQQQQRNNGSPETASSSGSSSRGYGVKTGVITRAEPQPVPYMEAYDASREQNYSMDCDGGSLNNSSVNERNEDSEAPSASGSDPLESRHKRDLNLRTIRKPEHDDYLHSYKFKNSIERRFSRSQDTEVDPKYKWVHDMSARPAQTHAQGKMYTHKRRRPFKPAPTPSTTTSNSGSNEDALDTSPQDTSSESPHHHYEKSVPPPTHLVPVFALNSLGKYYVPVSVDYSCLSRYLGPYNDVLDPRVAHLSAPLHPVTINVNFQPCLNYQVKQERNDGRWRQ